MTILTPAAINVFDYMTPSEIADVVSRTGSLDVSAAIQAADSAAAADYGVVGFPPGKYYIGTATPEALTISPGVAWTGPSGAYQGGATLEYGGTGAAVRGTNLRSNRISDLNVVCTNSASYGIHLDGAWLTMLERLAVSGATSYNIVVTTNGGTWGAQHNVLMDCDTSDGMLAFIGGGGVDEVTTTTVITHRGKTYKADNASIIFINCTAEGFSGPGYLFDHGGPSLMVGCDIEGSGSPGIQIANGHQVMEFGTIFAGFSGAAKVSGNFANQTFYGAGLSFTDGASAGTLLSSTVNWGDAYGGYAELGVMPTNTGGGSQDGYFQLSRYIGGAKTVQLELQHKFFLEHDKMCANTPVTALIVPIPNNVGVRIKTLASGLQSGAGSFCTSLECVAINSFGTVTQTSGSPLTAAAGGSSPTITYTVSSTDVHVQFNHGSASSGWVHFIFEIEGAFAYTKS